MPAWLRQRLDAGAQLSDFEVNFLCSSWMKRLSTHEMRSHTAVPFLRTSTRWTLPFTPAAQSLPAYEKWIRWTMAPLKSGIQVTAVPPLVGIW
ncbi:hypothetical protein [Pseudaquabacterium rugosum]